MYEVLEAKLAARCQWASEDGSPIAGSNPGHWEEIAAIARRRWISFERRNKNKEDNRTNRVEDLARGLCEKLEAGGLPMAGPLISDYRWLAEHLADILYSDLE
jgi:hypothetical protein